MGSILKGRGFKCVREISFCRFTVEQGQRVLAAKRRKSTAHCVSRGCKWEMIQPQRGEREKFSLWIRFVSDPF